MLERFGELPSGEVRQKSFGNAGPKNASLCKSCQKRGAIQSSFRPTRVFVRSPRPGGQSHLSLQSARVLTAWNFLVRNLPCYMLAVPVTSFRLSLSHRQFAAKSRKTTDWQTSLSHCFCVDPLFPGRKPVHSGIERPPQLYTDLTWWFLTHKRTNSHPWLRERVSPTQTMQTSRCERPLPYCSRTLED